MTRKDFALIAEAIAEVEAMTEDIDLNGVGASTLRILVSSLGSRLALTNSRFDPALFEIAALPRQAERRKQSIIKALGLEAS